MCQVNQEDLEPEGDNPKIQGRSPKTLFVFGPKKILDAMESECRTCLCFLQGHSTQSGPFEKALTDRNMKFEFRFKVVLKS